MTDYQISLESYGKHSQSGNLEDGTIHRIGPALFIQ